MEQIKCYCGHTTYCDCGPAFKVGDKLEAIPWHKEDHGIEYVTITSINELTQVYHWEADLKWELGGKLSSGYYFHEAKAYKPNTLKFNQEDFNLKAQHMFNTQVKPQIDKYEQRKLLEQLMAEDQKDGMYDINLSITGSL